MSEALQASQALFWSLPALARRNRSARRKAARRVEDGRRGHTSGSLLPPPTPTSGPTAAAAFFRRRRRRRLLPSPPAPCRLPSTTMAPKKELDKTISLQFVKEKLKRLNNGDVIAFYALKKPSDISSVYQPSDLPIVRLDLKEEGNDFQFDVMLKMNHRNILRLEAVQKIPGEAKLRVFVEAHGGPLIAHLRKLVADKTTSVIPSQTFRDLVRQMIDGIEELRVNSLYHGAVSIENICHSIDYDGIIIKLANFVHEVTSPGRVKVL